MKKVFDRLLMFVMAIAMVGLAVTQARADRITLNAGCLGASCNPETLTVSSASLSFGASSFTLDIAIANLAQLKFVPDVVGGSDLSVASAGAQTAVRVSVAQLGGLKSSALRTSAAVALLSNSLRWSFAGTHIVMNPLALSGNSRNGSFSVAAANVASALSISSASAKAGTTLQANGVASSSADTVPNIVAGPAVPEPTTMLLFGTGLVGAAAVLRKRLRGRRAESK